MSNDAPLTAEEEARWRSDPHADWCMSRIARACDCLGPRLVATLDAARAAVPDAEGLRDSAARELLDAVEALLTSEPKSYWLRGPTVKRLRSAYNAVVALASTPEDTGYE